MRSTILLAALLAISNLASAEIVNTRSEAYRTGTFHLAQANQALGRAIAELKKAEVSYEFPGLDITRMIGQIQEVELTTVQILAPERRRLKAQTLVPDGTFFHPIENSGVSTR